MRVDIRTLTPAAARALLTASKTRNRLLNNKLVKSYRKDMEAENWIQNGQTITITEHGDVLDGHHRLRALSECVGVSIVVPVVTVADSRSIETIDVGRPRSVPDLFEMKLGVNGLLALLASNLRWMIRGQSDCSTSRRESFEAVRNVYFNFEAGLKWALRKGWDLGPEVGPRPKCRNNIRPNASSASVIWAGLGAIYSINSELAEWILKDLSCEVEEKSELGVAFNKVMLNHIIRPTDRHSPIWVKERYIIGLNHYMAGTTTSYLKRSVNQKAPTLKLDLIKSVFGTDDD